MQKDRDLLNVIDQKEDLSKEVAEEVIANPQLLSEILKGVSSAIARTRFRSAKILRIISEKEPAMLYSKMDFFVDLLKSDNKIIMWNAMDIIANLTSVDPKNKFDKIFEKYYGLLSNESMVTAAHVIDNSGKIAKAKPAFQEKITDKLLELEEIPRDHECKNILLGKAILSFGEYFDQIQNKDEVIFFVKRQLNNPRNATKVKAEKFLKKYLKA